MDESTCTIIIPEEITVGSYANAFRVVTSKDGICMLDFVRYSASEGKAVMVSRIRVRPGFLPRIRDRLDGALS